MPRSILDHIVNWLPIILIVAAWFFIGRRHMAKQQNHVDEVTRINQETVALNRENQVLAREQLSVLKEIKAALENRKA